MQPDIVIVMPCGYDAEIAHREAEMHRDQLGRTGRGRGRRGRRRLVLLAPGSADRRRPRAACPHHSSRAVPGGAGRGPPGGALGHTCPPDPVRPLFERTLRRRSPAGADRRRPRPRPLPADRRAAFARRAGGRSRGRRGRGAGAAAQRAAAFAGLAAGLASVIAAAGRDAASLSALIRQRDVALVHSNTSVVLGGAAAAARARVPHVWHVREIYSRFGRAWPAYRAGADECAGAAVRLARERGPVRCQRARPDHL